MIFFSIFLAYIFKNHRGLTRSLTYEYFFTSKNTTNYSHRDVNVILISLFASGLIPYIMEWCVLYISYIDYVSDKDILCIARYSYGLRYTEV